MGRFANAVRALRGERRSTKRMGSLHGRSTSAGISVDPEAALQVTAVLSSVRLVSESIAGMPVSLHSRQGRKRLPVSAQFADVEKLLTVQPNPTMDAGEFWRTVVAWMLIRGNSYVYVQRNGAGKPIGLWPVPPSMVDVLRTPLGMFAYRLRHDQKIAWLPVEPNHIATHLDILHYRWFGTGPEGLSPIGVARQQIGISVAATGYIGGFFARDATPGAVITTDKNLTDAQWNRLVEQMEDRHEGFENSHRLSVFEGGAKLEHTTLSPADAEFIAIYKMTKTEIASLFGVPPHKVGDLDHATFSNIEHLSIEFVQDALLPPIHRLERVTRQLFGDDSIRIKFDPKGLLRGDTAAQTASYTAGRQWGWYSTNDILEMEDREPIEGGDEYLVPMNMIPATATTVQRGGNLPPVVIPTMQPTAWRTITPSSSRAAKSAADEAPEWVTRMETLLADYFEEQRDEILASNLSRSAAGRHTRALSDVDRDGWNARLAGLLADPYADIVSEFGSREAQALGGSFAPSKVTNWVQAAALRQARNINETTFNQLDDALDELDEEESAEDAASGVFSAASALRAGLVAVGIVAAIGAFGRYEGARQANGRQKTWRVNSNNPRPSHAAMDGETVPIDEAFSNGAMWPGDPAAGVDEVAGCSCGVEFDT